MPIPKGNTVIFTGDPGSGKTTFLLSYFKDGYFGCEEESKEEGSSGKKSTSKNTGSSNPAYRLLNSLIKPSSTSNEGKTEGLFLEKKCTNKSKNEETTKNIKVFISLESSFERFIENSHNLMNLEQQEADINNINVFIDATAFLSGRLDDSLRYPHLYASATTRDEKDCNDEGWKKYLLTLGGLRTAENQDSINFYWKSKDGDEVMLGERNDDDESPFNLDKNPKGKCDNDKQTNKALILMCPPQYDVMLRISLLKDILAQIFSFLSQGEKTNRLLLMDSLSALLNTFVEFQPNNSNTDQSRRVHIINFVRWLEENRVTTLMSAEAIHDQGQTMKGSPLFLGAQEKYIASGVVQLDYHQYQSGDLLRYFRILKMRGAAHDMRPYVYELGKSGLEWIHFFNTDWS